MLERARARELYDQLFVDELVTFCDSRPGQFDLVVSADTLVYFGVLEPAFLAMAKALRSGGGLIFTSERCADAEASAGYRIHPHGRYSHSKPYLCSTLALAGFEQIQIQPVELRKEAGKWVDGWLVAASAPVR
jgi:predicted TPR repeat methyltransferase